MQPKVFLAICVRFIPKAKLSKLYTYQISDTILDRARPSEFVHARKRRMDSRAQNENAEKRS